MMIKILKQPYPGSLLQFEIENTISVIAGLCVFFVLAFLRPFGLSAFGIEFILRDSTLFGIVTFLALKMNFILFKYLNVKGIVDEEKWTVGKEIIIEIWILLFIGICNCFLAHFVYHYPFTLALFTEGLKETVIVGIFPCLALLTIRQYTLLKKTSHLFLIVKSYSKSNNNLPLIKAYSTTKKPYVSRILELSILETLLPYPLFANCPQAASISFPLLWRKRTFTRFLSRWFMKLSITPSSGLYNL